MPLEVSLIHRRDGIQRWPLPALADVPLSDLVPVREPSNTHHQSQRPSRYWLATSDEHVTTRTRMAEAHLRALDFAPEVVGVRAEPFALHAGSRTIKGHTPDFLVEYADGGRAVVDVVGPRRAGHQTVRRCLALTDQACERLGWEHRVLGEPNPVVARNLAWLAGFRRTSCDEPEVATALLTAAEQPVALGQLAVAAGPPWRTRPVVFHLLWRQRLAFALDRPLGDETLVWRAG